MTEVQKVSCHAKICANKTVIWRFSFTKGKSGYWESSPKLDRHVLDTFFELLIIIWEPLILIPHCSYENFRCSYRYSYSKVVTKLPALPWALTAGQIANTRRYIRAKTAILNNRTSREKLLGRGLQVQQRGPGKRESEAIASSVIIALGDMEIPRGKSAWERTHGTGGMIPVSPHGEFAPTEFAPMNSS